MYGGDIGGWEYKYNKWTIVWIHDKDV